MLKELVRSITICILCGVCGMSTVNCNESKPLTSPAQSIHEFTMKTIDGKEKKLSDYAGKVVLLVNVASQCGYTRQYANLELLYKKFNTMNFMIAGFPANNFGGQEPGSDAEIKEFCTTKFNVTFDMFGKISVKGNDKHPLYGYLTSGGGNQNLAGEVGWNFEKFLVDTNGKIVKRYNSGVDPMSEEVLNDIQKLLK